MQEGDILYEYRRSFRLVRKKDHKMNLWTFEYQVKPYGDGPSRDFVKWPSDLPSAAMHVITVLLHEMGIEVGGWLDNTPTFDEVLRELTWE